MLNGLLDSSLERAVLLIVTGHHGIAKKIVASKPIVRQIHSSAVASHGDLQIGTSVDY